MKEIVKTTKEIKKMVAMHFNYGITNLDFDLQEMVTEIIEEAIISAKEDAIEDEIEWKLSFYCNQWTIYQYYAYTDIRTPFDECLDMFIADVTSIFANVIKGGDC